MQSELQSASMGKSMREASLQQEIAVLRANVEDLTADAVRSRLAADAEVDAEAQAQLRAKLLALEQVCRSIMSLLISSFTLDAHDSCHRTNYCCYHCQVSQLDSFACMLFASLFAAQTCDDMKSKHAAELRDTLALLRHDEHMADVFSSAELVREREQ